MTIAASERASAALGCALVALAAVGWGCWPLFLRRAEAISPLPAALEAIIVMGVLTVASGPLCFYDRVRRRATALEWGGVAWLGIGDALNVLLFFGAYQTTSVAIAVLTHYLTPIFVALGAPLVLHERVRARTLIAVAIALAGLVFLLAPWSAERHRSDWLGAALGAGSAIFYAANVLVNKRLTGAFSGSELVFFHGLVALPLLALLLPHGPTALRDPRALEVIALGAVFSGALASLFFVWGLRRIEASRASTLTLLEPLVAVLLATLAFHEPFRLLSALGATLILASAMMVVWRGRV